MRVLKLEPSSRCKRRSFVPSPSRYPHDSLPGPTAHKQNVPCQRTITPSQNLLVTGPLKEADVLDATLTPLMSLKQLIRLYFCVICFMSASLDSVARIVQWRYSFRAQTGLRVVILAKIKKFNNKEKGTSRRYLGSCSMAKSLTLSENTQHEI